MLLLKNELLRNDYIAHYQSFTICPIKILMRLPCLTIIHSQFICIFAAFNNTL